ncbi:hypothetical protein ACPA9J_32805 [Pseudomonas aeruginosa]
MVNALDNLSGTDALISVRSRGRFSRPFVVVERLQREAPRRASGRRRSSATAPRRYRAATRRPPAGCRPGEGRRTDARTAGHGAPVHAGEAAHPQESCARCSTS